jgi:hypothetical protein
MTKFRPRLRIKNGILIDGSGCDPVANTLVVVEGNRIAYVGPADGGLRPESPDDTVIDAAGDQGAHQRPGSLEGCDRLRTTVRNRLCLHGIDGDLANLSPYGPQGLQL